MRKTSVPKTTVCLKLSPTQLQFLLKHDLMSKAGFKASPTRAFHVMLDKLGYKEPKIPKVTKVPAKERLATKKRK